MEIQIKGQPFTVVETDYLKKCAAMTQATISNPFNKMGIIIGKPGTGKTIASYYLAQNLNGHRFCCNTGMTKKSLLAMIARQYGLIKPNTSFDDLTSFLSEKLAGELIIVDEANQLSVKPLEALRYFADEIGTNIILVGTDILAQILQDQRTAIYLAQIQSRIGAKRSHFTPIGGELPKQTKPTKPTEETLRLIQKYFITPNDFGISNKKIVLAFYKYTNGYWRVAKELIEACQRAMKANNLTTLTLEIVEIAARDIKLN